MERITFSFFLSRLKIILNFTMQPYLLHETSKISWRQENVTKSCQENQARCHIFVTTSKVSIGSNNKSFLSIYHLEHKVLYIFDYNYYLLFETKHVRKYFLYHFHFGRSDCFAKLTTKTNWWHYCLIVYGIQSGLPSAKYKFLPWETVPLVEIASRNVLRNFKQNGGSFNVFDF